MSKLGRQMALLVAASNFGILAHAEPPNTFTLSTVVQPTIVGGGLEGCQLGFEVAREDFQYNDGSYVYLVGNLAGLLSQEGELWFKLKLSIFNLDDKKLLAAPAQAYLVSGFDTNIADLKSSFDGDDGSRHYIYHSRDATLRAMAAMRKDQTFTFAYAMEEGGLSAIVPVDLQIEKMDLEIPENSTVTDRTANEWATCMAAVIKVAKTRVLALK